MEGYEKEKEDVNRVERMVKRSKKEKNRRRCWRRINIVSYDPNT